MSTIRMHSMWASYNIQFGATKFFKWVDDVNEDQEFVDLLTSENPFSQYNSAKLEDFAIDRSGVTPKLTWNLSTQNYSTNPPTWNSPVPMEEELIADQVWNPKLSVYGVPDRPAVHDTTGWWECDFYGRPIRLQDMGA